MVLKLRLLASSPPGRLVECAETNAFISSLAALLICLLAFGATAQDETAPIFQPEPRPMPASVQIEDGLQLEYYFTSLTQGGVGLLR